MMDLNPSGYYKWLKHKDNPNQYEQNRLDLTALLLAQSKRHKSWGYHRLAAGIRSKAHAYHYRKAGTESIRFPNIVKGNLNAQRVLSIIVSDMTCLRNKCVLYELTLLWILSITRSLLIAFPAMEIQPLITIALISLNRKSAKEQTDRAGSFAHRAMRGLFLQSLSDGLC
ncbi:MAG: hypothetical protein ACOX8S_05145 [Christensenellales bacterium]|jgi:hypothetical protein